MEQTPHGGNQPEIPEPVLVWPVLRNCHAH
jgi:hypothetical protein